MDQNKTSANSRSTALFYVSFQECSRRRQKGSTVLIQRKTATPVWMPSKPAISTAAVRGSDPPSSPPASKRIPTRAKRAARSAAIKRSGRSWTACRPSLATGFCSAPARRRAVQSGGGKQSCPIALITIKTNPTAWSCGWSAARTPSAGKMERHDAVIGFVIDLYLLFKGLWRQKLPIRCF